MKNRLEVGGGTWVGKWTDGKRGWESRRKRTNIQEKVKKRGGEVERMIGFKGAKTG